MLKLPLSYVDLIKRVLNSHGTANVWRQLKYSLNSLPILAVPCYQLQFILDLDAGENGLHVGAVWSQIQNGLERSIPFADKTFKGGQKNYTVYQNEILALAWRLDHFESYVYGQQLTVCTEIQALLPNIGVVHRPNRIKVCFRQRVWKF